MLLLSLYRVGQSQYQPVQQREVGTIRVYFQALNFFILFTVPGPPASVAVLDRTVIWQSPQSPNGNLLGYIIRVYSAGNIGQAQTINVGVNPLYYQLMTEHLPAGNNLQVQVIII